MDILQLESPFSLIEDTEYSFIGVILKVGRRDLQIFLGIHTEDATCTLRGDIIVFLLIVVIILLIVREMPSSIKGTSYRL